MKVVIKQKEKAMLAVEQEIEDSSKAYETEFANILKFQQHKNKLQLELSNEESELSRKNKMIISQYEIMIEKLNYEIAECRKDEISSLAKINEVKRQSQEINEANDKLRGEWSLANARQLILDDNSLNCPTCHQALPDEQRNNTVNKLTKNFNESKQNELNRISQIGKQNKAIIESNTTMIEELNIRIN